MDGTAAAVRQQAGGLSSVFSGVGKDSGSKFKAGILGGVAGLGASLAAMGIGNIIGDSIRTGFDFAMDGIDIASDVGETTSAVEQVFGQESLAGIETWASQGADALGQTKLDALQAAQSFGVYGKAAGLAGDDLTGFATNLADLGTDLGSFFNTDTSQAIEAIGAGLRGESEPLRKYGVLLDDATLRARALSLGIYDGVGSLTQQQRVLAAQAEMTLST